MAPGRSPLPSPMHESEKWKWSRSVVSASSQPHGLQPTRLFCPWDFPGKSTGVSCHCLLQSNKTILYQIGNKSFFLLFLNYSKISSLFQKFSNYKLKCRSKCYLIIRLKFVNDYITKQCIWKCKSRLFEPFLCLQLVCDFQCSGITCFNRSLVILRYLKDILLYVT